MKKIKNVRLKMLDYINENLYSDLYSKNKTKKDENDEIKKKKEKLTAKLAFYNK